MDDGALLRQFVDDRSEPAFTALVERHFQLVHSAALRRVGNDHHMAADVAQNVFCDLARKAPALRDRASLAGWLYTSTRFASSQAVRSAARRRAHEREAHDMQTFDSPPQLDWGHLRPVIDEAMDELSGPDREAVLMRYFAQRTHAEVGKVLGLTADAARMRTDRALERLRAFLSRHGVTSTAGALAAVLADQPATAAPAGLVGRIAAEGLRQGVLTPAAGIGGVAAKVGLGAAAVAAGIGALIYFKSPAPSLTSAPLPQPPPQADATPPPVPRPAIQSPSLPPAAPATHPRRNAVPVQRANTRQSQTTVVQEPMITLFDRYPLPSPADMASRLDTLVGLTPSQKDLSLTIFQEESDSLASKVGTPPAAFRQYLEGYGRVARRQLWAILTPDQQEAWAKIPQQQGGVQGTEVAVGR